MQMPDDRSEQDTGVVPTPEFEGQPPALDDLEGQVADDAERAWLIVQVDANGLTHNTRIEWATSAEAALRQAKRRGSALGNLFTLDTVVFEFILGTRFQSALSQEVATLEKPEDPPKPVR